MNFLCAITFEPAIAAPVPDSQKESAHSASKARKEGKRLADATARRNEALEQELEETKIYHQALVADFEAAQEELTSGNGYRSA